MTYFISANNSTSSAVVFELAMPMMCVTIQLQIAYHVSFDNFLYLANINIGYLIYKSHA